MLVFNTGSHNYGFPANSIALCAWNVKRTRTPDFNWTALIKIQHKSSGKTVREKLCPRSWVRPYSISMLQYFPIRTDQGRQITSIYISFDYSAFLSVHCPYDTESILMIVLTSILILEAAISLSGVIESSQLLCCAVSVSLWLIITLWLVTWASKMALFCYPDEAC